MEAKQPSSLPHFYPRPPRGGRRENLSQLPPDLPISTHALREEGDFRLAEQSRFLKDFYPRPPRGGRQNSCRMI